MQRTVRIGTVEDQDRMRREQAMQMTPDERVEALLRFRQAYFGDRLAHIQRVATVKRLPGTRP